MDVSTVSSPHFVSVSSGLLSFCYFLRVLRALPSLSTMSTASLHSGDDGKDSSTCKSRDLESCQSPPQRSDNENAEPEQRAEDEKAEPEQRPRPEIVDWDGPDDPGNAQNWPLASRCYHTFMPSAAAFVCTIASSIYTPGRSEVAAEFGVSDEVALLPYALYVVGLAFGPLLAAPCSETFGRRPVYLVGIPIFALFTLGAGFSNNAASLIICRFLSGVFGSPALAVGSATIADVWKPHRRALPMTLYVLTPFLGPALGPLIGGYATENRGWRWTMWATAIIAAAVIAAGLAMKETYKSQILKVRAKKAGARYPGQQRAAWEASRVFVTSTLTRPVHMGFTEPVAGLLALYVAFNFAMMYSFFAAFPAVFAETYGFSLGQIGLTFLAVGVGAVLACVAIVCVDRSVFQREVRAAGKVTPERRLCFGMAASAMLPPSLFWFAWSARPAVHWICPVVAEAVFGCGNLLVFMSAVLYVTDVYGARFTASAMGANNLARYILAAAFPLFVTYMYDGLGTDWATSVLGFISLCLSPIPWAFYIWGPKLRAMSRYQ